MKASKYYQFILLLFLMPFASGCTDDNLGFSDEDLREGATTLSLDAVFSPFAEGDLTRATVAPPGRGMNVLNDLVILVYDKDGNLLEDYTQNVKFSPEQVTDEIRGESDTSNGKTPAESDTKCLSDIPLRLPFGEYYIIAAANLEKQGVNEKGESSVTVNTFEALTIDHAEEIKTLDGLRRIKVKWQADNFRNNCEMLGYFADPEAQAPRSSSEFPTVKVNRSGMKLRAWLRRCASKITIDFDGTDLRENVYIYIKEARIYDIASECTLGFGIKPNGNDVIDYNNKITDEKYLLNRPENGPAGHHIDYRKNDDEDYHNWPCITKGTPFIRENMEDPHSEIIDFHNQEAKALFFYENMQGDLPSGSKIPHADLDNGTVIDPDELKDGMKYGSYIEVTAYYHSEADGNVSDGDIKYRFMIGKDVEKNCDAERNYHYKLTLKFRGNANDYDWHIDYKEEEGFDTPNPCYISYLYNHSMSLPFKYTPPQGWEVIGMKANIIQNPWYPSDVPEDKLSDPDIEITPTVPAGDGSEPYNELLNRQEGNGFLSLYEPKSDIIKDTDANDGNKTFDNTNGYTSLGEDGNIYINNRYYQRKNLSERVFMKDNVISPNNGSESEKFQYTKNGDKYTFNIPLFTREKVMVKQTGYTGNNPFVGYQRIARIVLTATIRKKGTNVTDERKTPVNVVQVRRVVNPKGVYRKEGNYAPFHVVMMHLNSDAADAVFTPINSRGPWMAEVIGDDNFITLDGKHTVAGSTNTDIDFTIRFNRMSTGNKNAVVRVRYHNYTCTHLIFVRQGYDSQQISGNATESATRYPESTFSNPTLSTTKAAKWSTFNMIAEDKEASDPRDEGSMFKFGNYEYPIDACNNAYTIGGKEVYHEMTKEQFVPQGPFFIAGSDGNLMKDPDKTDGSLLKMEWSNIISNGAGFKNSDKKIKNVATIYDFEQLYLTPNVHFGYGVLYADGATETQSTIDMAYGWKRGGDNAKGMRGVFAYYWDGNVQNGSEYNGNNIFFPIGRSGYGHRKNAKETEVNNDGKGILRYSALRCQPTYEYKVQAYKNFVQIAPLFVYLYRRSGAIYWARETVGSQKFHEWNGMPGSGTAYGLDFNYFSLDVNAITATNIDHGKDACFVRCVE